METPTAPTRTSSSASTTASGFCIEKADAPFGVLLQMRVTRCLDSSEVPSPWAATKTEAGGSSAVNDQMLQLYGRVHGREHGG